jgi:hypothetical protein
MANGRAVDWEDPRNSRRKAARILDRDPVRELHQGPRSYAPHREAGHMTAPDHIANATSKNPCMRGPSTYELCIIGGVRFRAQVHERQRSRSLGAKIQTNLVSKKALLF